MNRIERAVVIILVISVILSIGFQLILPFPYGLGVGIGFFVIVIYVIIKKGKVDSKPQNDDIQKLKDRVEELEKDKEKNSENS